MRARNKTVTRFGISARNTFIKVYYGCDPKKCFILSTSDIYIYIICTEHFLNVVDKEIR